MIELTLEEVASLFEMIGDPYKWRDNIRNKVLKNGVDDSTDCHLISGTTPIVFKLEQVGHSVKWRPAETIIIKSYSEKQTV